MFIGELIIGRIPTLNSEKKKKKIVDLVQDCSNSTTVQLL